MEEENLNKESEDEFEEIEVTEISLNEEDIDELMGMLKELKQTKTEVTFEVDDENEFLIKYDGGEND